MRGEQLFRLIIPLWVGGSPPLARGTVDDDKAMVLRSGITPACAGNSWTDDEKAAKEGDHPRLRGEQVTSPALNAVRLGSPPLARGTGKLHRCDMRYAGITPACAGNSWYIKCNKRERRDHPRLRGEQSLSLMLPCRGLGSPPLARGTDRVFWSKWAVFRITPACAGNRKSWKVKLMVQWDHPRLRGEQRGFLIVFIGKRGSPPLARGTVLWAVAQNGKLGITPACAGNRNPLCYLTR